MNSTKLDLMILVSQLEDPRSRTCLHNFHEIVVITICAAICGLTEWEEIYEFAVERKTWLQEKLQLKLTEGIPSLFTFARVISSINASSFSKIFTDWIQKVYPPKENQVIGIDGKSLLGSYTETKGKELVHLVNAIACDTGITLAQLEVNLKENEITAIPKLLEYLDIRKSIITMDAMGSQKSIAELIRLKQAHYIFAIKSNRKFLYKALQSRLEEALKDSNKFNQKRFSAKLEDQHGRVEERTCIIVPIKELPADLEDEIELWKDVKTAVMIKYVQTYKATGEVKEATRFFITSLDLDAETIAQSIREHWYIENKLHWVLDVVYREDDSRLRINSGPHNSSLIKKMALNFLRADTSFKKSIKLKQRKALMNTNFLEHLLGIKSD
jgi:predicted transposase YbfD/YdcC